VIRGLRRDPRRRHVAAYPFSSCSKQPATSQEWIEIALINNMPDLALEEAESQLASF
jgi:hypothetical protein